MHIKTRVLAVPVFLLASTTFAATEFDGQVPVDVVRQMVSGEIYADVPDDFPEFDLPNQLSIMGSVSSDFYSQVIFSATVNTDEGVQLLAESFIETGWIRLPPVDYQPQPQQTGFIRLDVEQPAANRNDTLCHNTYGTLTVTPGNDNAGNGSISARLNNIRLRQPGYSCQQEISRREMSSQRRGAMPFRNPNAEYMPRLVLPAEENAPQFAIARIDALGSSSSGGDTEIRSSIQGSDIELSELYDHFAVQLEEQGWERDSEWSGEVSAGGYWASNPASEMSFIGVLSILNRVDSVFELTFSLLPRNTPNTDDGVVGVRP